MKKIKALQFLIFFVFSLLFTQACSGQQGPKPIKYGHEQCAHCKMTVSDIRFGTQLKTKKGRTYVFDDISCMVQFVNKGEIIQKADVQSYYLPDYSLHKLFEGEKMFFFKSENLKSPMRGDIAAFSDEDEMKKIATEFEGQTLRWVDLWKN